MKQQKQKEEENRQAAAGGREESRFTRGRGMLHPSEGLGGRSGGLAGGGVSRPPDRLDSGELMGVRVTEEISRQESAVMLSHQKREDGLRSMYASSSALVC